MEKIREFFWPLLERGQVREIVPLNADDINLDSKNLQKALDYSLKIYESEMTRNSTIENKASLFIGTLAIITSVVLAITTTLIGQKEFSGILLSMILVLFVLIIYVLRTVWFAIKVHERKAFYTFYHDDIFKIGNEEQYSKTLISSIVNKTKKNSTVINSKIDNMVMAQEYYKRAIVTLAFYSILLILLFIAKCKFGIIQTAVKLTSLIDKVNFETFFILFLMFIGISSVIINFMLLKRLASKQAN